MFDTLADEYEPPTTRERSRNGRKFLQATGAAVATVTVDGDRDRRAVSAPTKTAVALALEAGG